MQSLTAGSRRVVGRSAGWRLDEGVGAGRKRGEARLAAVSATNPRRSHDDGNTNTNIGAGGEGARLNRRHLAAATAAGLLGLSGSGSGDGGSALALGPSDVFLEIQKFEDVECAEGAPKGARCIQVYANGNLTSKKPAYNGEVFGKIRYKGSGESAIYGDYAEATDAGKIGDIDEVPPGKNDLKFTLLLQPPISEDNANKNDLEFIGLKIRVYPGMRKDFRIMKPVSETLDVCDPDYDICD